MITYSWQKYFVCRVYFIFDNVLVIDQDMGSGLGRDKKQAIKTIDSIIIKHIYIVRMMGDLCYC